MSGKQPKNLNAKMRHFTFVDTFYKAIKLMSEAESGQYVKAICEYMFNGTERKLNRLWTHISHLPNGSWNCQERAIKSAR